MKFSSTTRKADKLKNRMADYTGARGSNAGDEFHELWALRQAISMLDGKSNLAGIYIEGVPCKHPDEHGGSNWEGVDCTLMYGGASVESATRIEIVQLKYSGANPNSKWTLGRLSARPKGRPRGKSVISSLAKDFKSLRRTRPDLLNSEQLVPRFISNQPVDASIIDELSSIRQSGGVVQKPALRSKIKTLALACGLTGEDRRLFLRSLIFECGERSRFALEAEAILMISSWTDQEARGILSNMLLNVRRAMFPEGAEILTRERVLSWMDLADPSALFPCDPKIGVPASLVPREISRKILEYLESGVQRICLHGAGGVGKTTILHELSCLLPEDSEFVLFDCYGAGTYLDSESPRHRAQDAFLQLTNELARKLRMPFLITRSSSVNYPKAFKKRLEKASELVSARSDKALLVVVMDAADNSILAGKSKGEKTFVPDFLGIGILPRNVRFIVTTRTARLRDVDLPESYTKIEVPKFTLKETAAYARLYWPEAPTIWIEELHRLSSQNPRLQYYVLDHAKLRPELALDFLLPIGKNLDNLFEDLFEEAWRKGGDAQELRSFCATLVELPRPIPVEVLSDIFGIQEGYLRDICLDLAPGLRLEDGLISFIDEDIEHFVREKAEGEAKFIRERIASYFVEHHGSSVYASTHLALALFAAGRHEEILRLVRDGGEPFVISDPIARRQVYLHRLQLAMKVCRQSGNNVEAILTLLAGAEAVKTDSIVRATLMENFDLAATFSSETIGKLVLQDQGEAHRHGPLLFHMMAAEGRLGRSISVDALWRQATAWGSARRDALVKLREEGTDRAASRWDISYEDIAAEIEGILLTRGAKAGVREALRWVPRSVGLRVGIILTSRLIKMDRIALVRDCILEGNIEAPWRLFLLVPLALAGEQVDLSDMQACLSMLDRRNLIQPNKLSRYGIEDEFLVTYFETILTACEYLVGKGVSVVAIGSILDRFLLRDLLNSDRLHASQTSLIDLCLRAHALLENGGGRRLKWETLCTEPQPLSPDSNGANSGAAKLAQERSNRELKDFVEPLLGLYGLRARIILCLEPTDDFISPLRREVQAYNDDYRVAWSPYAGQMKIRASRSLAHLELKRGINAVDLFEISSILAKGQSGETGEMSVRFLEEFCHIPSLRERIVRIISEDARQLTSLKIASETKIRLLIEQARAVLPISVPDSHALFHLALDVARDVNDDISHELSLFEPLSLACSSSTGAEVQREVATNIAIAVGDAVPRLDNPSAFPWKIVGGVLGRLDVNVAIAATARWEDSNVVDRERILGAILLSALRAGRLTCLQVVALTPCLKDLDEDLVRSIVDQSMQENKRSEQVAEELARDELLWFGKGERPVIFDLLRRLPRTDGFSNWIDRLARSTAFQTGLNSERKDNDARKQVGVPKVTQPDIFDGFDWGIHNFASATDIKLALEYGRAAAVAGGTTYVDEQIMDILAEHVRVNDRVHHLTAMFEIISDFEFESSFNRILQKRVSDWKSSLSVEEWCNTRFMEFIKLHLPVLSAGVEYGQGYLPDFLSRCNLPKGVMLDQLLAGIELHVDKLDTATIYGIVAVILNYCEPGDAGAIALAYSTRLVSRIVPGDRDVWDEQDIPKDASQTLARFCYALMSDIDLRIRWRAAHAIRRCARLGEVAVLDAAFGLYNRKEEKSFRDPEANFYWLAARLWLVIASSKIADESAAAIAKHSKFIFEIATSDDFPHVLIKSFAKATVLNLIKHGPHRFTRGEVMAIGKVNQSSRQPQKVNWPYASGFDNLTRGREKKSRFEFDSMDTLRYWYNQPLHAFADVKTDEFLEAAERWIIDVWRVSGEVWRFDNEVRRSRFSSDYRLIHNDHGSLPTFERFSTHLEWHAMFCVVGELLRSRRLAMYEEFDYRSFDEWLRSNSLASPPEWLEDFNGPRPLEREFWVDPENDVDWIEGVSEVTFLRHAGLDNSNDSIIVAAYTDSTSSNFHSYTHLKSALVAPLAASSLVRALQTIDLTADYQLPSAGSDFEFDSGQFRLLGWLEEMPTDSKIEGKDELNFGVTPPRFSLIPEALKVLGPILIASRPGKSRAMAFSARPLQYIAWGTPQNYEYNDYIPSGVVLSGGSRLHVDRRALQKFLRLKQLDLILEVEIFRKCKEHVTKGFDQKRARQETYDKLFLLRQDGTLETAEGRVGTWILPSSRTKSGR